MVMDLRSQRETLFHKIKQSTNRKTKTKEKAATEERKKTQSTQHTSSKTSHRSPSLSGLALDIISAEQLVGEALSDEDWMRDQWMRIAEWH